MPTRQQTGQGELDLGFFPEDDFLCLYDYLLRRVQVPGQVPVAWGDGR